MVAVLFPLQIGLHSGMQCQGVCPAICAVKQMIKALTGDKVCSPPGKTQRALIGSVGVVLKEHRAAVGGGPSRVKECDGLFRV
jgi:hypothetical protein